MADPPAEIHERQRESAEERAGEEHEPDHDGQIGDSPREQEGVRSPDREPGEEEQTDGEERPGGRRARIRHAWHEPRHEHADEADRKDDRDDGCDEAEQERESTGARSRLPA